MNATTLLTIASFLVASPALASQPRLHLISTADVGPSSAPLVDHGQAPGTLRLASDLTAPQLPGPVMPPLQDKGGGGGGSVRSDTIGILAILVAALVGFGLGHLLVQDREGFILFLVVDLVIIVAAGVLQALLWSSGFWWLGYQGLGSLALLISHIVQVLDVYPKATGSRLLQRARDNALLIASPGLPESRWTPAVRTFGLAF